MNWYRISESGTEKLGIDPEILIADIKEDVVKIYQIFVDEWPKGARSRSSYIYKLWTNLVVPRTMSLLEDSIHQERINKDVYKRLIRGVDKISEALKDSAEYAVPRNTITDINHVNFDLKVLKLDAKSYRERSEARAKRVEEVERLHKEILRKHEGEGKSLNRGRPYSDKGDAQFTKQPGQMSPKIKEEHFDYKEELRSIQLGRLNRLRALQNSLAQDRRHYKQLRTHQTLNTNQLRTDDINDLNEKLETLNRQMDRKRRQIAALTIDIKRWARMADREGEYELV